MQPVHLSGIVSPFEGHGSELGYPTANLKTSTDLADGVYFGFADLAEFQANPALIFVGTPVTFGDGERRVEAHLLDIPGNIFYGQVLSLDVRYFHRANQKFPGKDELLAAMKKDEAAGREWFKKNPLALSD